MAQQDADGDSVSGNERDESPDTSEAAGDHPPVPVMEGVSLEDITIERDGTHTGPAVKRLDSERDVVIVCCPCGHYRARLPIELRKSYYNGSVTCKGSLPGYPR